MESNQYELVVSQPPNPLWKNFIAALFFTLALYAIYAIATQPHFSHLDATEVSEFDKNIVFIIVGVFMGIYCSVIISVMIDIDDEKMVTTYSVGPLSRTRNTTLPQLDYVGIYKNAADIYLIRIWYAKNKHYTMCYTEEREPAFKFALMVSKKLKLDLLDATEKGHSQWIEKSESEAIPIAQN